MEIVIHGDKVKVTKAMKDYIEEKLNKLDKYLENSETVRANVIVKVTNHEQRVEITIPLKSFILRSEEEQNDFYAAVDKTIDKLERQIRKNKTRLMSKKIKQSMDFNFENFTSNEEEKNENIINENTINEIDLNDIMLDEAVKPVVNLKYLLNFIYFNFFNEDFD